MTPARKSLTWALAAIALWILAAALDRRTEVEIYSDGGTVHATVAGSSLSAPILVERLQALAVRAMDSIDPPGGGALSITGDRGTALSARLPHRFDLPTGALVPVGDWELDELAGEGQAWRQEVVVKGPFTVAATFRGRFHHDLRLELEGEPPVSVAIRRGLINHDAFIRDANGRILAVTSIDPTPGADLGAILATLLRAASVASVLIALFSLLEAVSPISPVPAATRRWRAWPWVAIAAVAAVSLSGWVAHDVLEGLPHLPDSVTYLMQARWLQDGHLWGTAPAYVDHLSVPYTYVRGDRWLGHYPFGWPLLLSVGLIFGAPWVVAPLFGGLFVILLYLAGREIDGPILGLTAATLGLLSPLVRLISGSLLSHAAAASFLLGGLWMLLSSRRLESTLRAASAGIAVGLAFAIRPLSAAAVAAPFAVLLIADLARRRDRGARNRLIAWCMAGAAAAVPTLGANALITGSPLSFPYSLASGPMYFAANLPFGLRNLDTLLYSTANSIHGWGWPSFYGPFWVAVGLAFAFVPFLVRRARTADLLMAAMVAAVMIAHLGSRGHGLHGFGPRYHFEVVAPLLLLSARGFAELARLGTRGRELERRLHITVVSTLFAALCLSAAAVLPERLALYHGYNGVDGSLERQVAAAGIKRGLVLLPPDDWRGWAMAAGMVGTGAQADLLFVQAEPDDQEISEIAGDRPVFQWRSNRLMPVEQTVQTLNVERSTF
jgi:4-amino-4-deoxy-L-arabinose transferase-like glycosyltransferase